MKLLLPGEHIFKDILASVVGSLEIRIGRRTESNFSMKGKGMNTCITESLQPLKVWKKMIPQYLEKIQVEIQGYFFQRLKKTNLC